MARNRGESDYAYTRRVERVANYQAKRKAEKIELAKNWLEEHKNEQTWGKNIKTLNVNPNDPDEHRLIEFSEARDRNGQFYIVALNGRTSAGYGRFDKFTFQDKNEAIAKQKELYAKELKRIKKIAND